MATSANSGDNVDGSHENIDIVLIDDDDRRNDNDTVHATGNAIAEATFDPTTSTEAPTAKKAKSSDGSQIQPLTLRSSGASAWMDVTATEHVYMKGVADDDDDDGCPICFEPWTSAGIHRLCSLRCGHLFGKSCLDAFFDQDGQRCPLCNGKASRRDIRCLFAKVVCFVT